MNGIISGKSGVSGGAKSLLIYETITTVRLGTETFIAPFYPVMITIRQSSYSQDAVINFASRESKYNTTGVQFWAGGYSYANCIITWSENTVSVQRTGGQDIDAGSPVIILGY